MKCFIEFYCKGDLCEHFLVNFATEFHEKDTEEDKGELLSFIFEIIQKTPKNDLTRPEVEGLLRDFMQNKYFHQKKEQRPTVLKMMQLVFSRTGKFIELDQDLEYLKG